MTQFYVYDCMDKVQIYKWACQNRLENAAAKLAFAMTSPAALCNKTSNISSEMTQDAISAPGSCIEKIWRRFEFPKLTYKTYLRFMFLSTFILQKNWMNHTVSIASGSHWKSVRKW